MMQRVLDACRSLGGTLKSRVGGGSPPHSAEQSRVVASASPASQPRPPRRFGPKIPWDSQRDGGIANAETMRVAFARAGFPRTKALNFPAGHVLKDHAHNKRGYKRVGVVSSAAEGGGAKFAIRPKAWKAGSGGDADSRKAEAEAPVASMSDIELSHGDCVDIPPGLVHSAWVVGDQGIVFVMGDEEEEG